MPATPNKPAWFTWAEAEAARGVKEVPGPKSNPRIMEYRTIAKTPLGGEDGEVPWCAIFVNAGLEDSGVKGSRSAMARSFERSPDFVKLAGPALGAIVTKWRVSPTSGLGHVGYYAGHDSAGKVVFLGGNQGDMAKMASFDPAVVVGYYWPKGQPLPVVGKVSAGAALATATEV